MKVLKNFSTAVLAIVMTIAMCTTCFAGSWEGYFGKNSNWNEGASGTMSQSTTGGFTMNIDEIGWGGVWGCQSHKDISVKKGQKYTLQFKMQSEVVEKWVFFKITDDNDTMVYADWVHLIPGVTTNYKATFKAEQNAKYIYFGMGGEFGDRLEEQGEIYNLLETLPDDADASYSTTIKMTGFKLAKTNAKVKIAKKSKSNATALYNYLKKNGKIIKIVDGYACIIQKSGSKINMTVLQNQKKIVNTTFTKTSSGKALKKIKKGSTKAAAKALEKALKTETKLTFKKLGC